MSNELEVLKECFEYDLWANLQWLVYLDSFGAGDTERSIFQHILAGQDLWLLRCQGTSLMDLPQFPATEKKGRELNQAWLQLLAANSHDPTIVFTRPNGESFEQPVSRIARHVIDHGAYHRGELRGLCRARNAEDFPEAGLMRFYNRDALG